MPQKKLTAEQKEKRLLQAVTPREQRPPHPARSRNTVAPFIVIVIVLLAIAVAVASRVLPGFLNPAIQEADKHASNAATAMVQSQFEIPTAYAASNVVGTSSDTTIDAMRATGTTYNGTVVLRITVSIASGMYEGDHYAQRCYEYDFNHTSFSNEPQQVRCPSGAPLNLQNLPPLALADTDSPKLLQTLNNIPAANRNNVTVVKEAVTTAFPYPKDVTVVSNKNGIEVSIKSGTTCLTGAVTSNTAVTVGKVASGYACLGG